MRTSSVAVALGFASLFTVSTAWDLRSETPHSSRWSGSWGAGAAWAQGFGSAAPDRFFRVEAEGGQGRGGRPVVRGYVNNDYGQAAGRVLLQVETLDASGQVVARSLVPVDGTVPGFGRLYFEGPVTTAGARYRVTVYYFEWIHRGGGGS
jgi:hypothetical protein